MTDQHPITYEGKKLYVVAVEYQAYVLAEEYEDAEDFYDKIVDNGNPFISCISVTKDEKNPLKWITHTCIYHPDQDTKGISLREVIGV